MNLHSIINRIAQLRDVVLTSLTAGDVLTWDGSKWVNAAPSGGGGGGSVSGMRRKAGNTQGSTNTNIVIYGTSVHSAGSDVTHNDANMATDGSVFTIVNTGIYSITANVYASATAGYYLMRNATVTNTQADANTLNVLSTVANSYTHTLTFVGKLTAGDKVWIHYTSPPSSNDYYNTFEIQRLI